jgi:hypothetical protein
LNLRQFFIRDARHLDCAGTQEHPNRAIVAEIAPEKIKSLGEDGLSG